MGILDSTSTIPTLIMSPRDTEVMAMINTVEVPSAPIKEDIVYQKFGDMGLPEDDDGDYSPSDVDSDDSLEWASETERTMLEDALAEGNVGINYADGTWCCCSSSSSPSAESCQGCEEGWCQEH